ncbi:palmitoyltransferase ZDHHC6-like isoform X2 [Dermacentor albipictus]|uniref:palmitoyltransferase ZDHHC6-like isoform X2 n=1 Tax=Dermacentor albipictus TaxID=60249 RepID=UPI0031FDDC56
MEPQPGVLDILAQFCHRLLHWGPLTALFIIKFIFLTSLYVTSMWLSPYGSTLGTVNHAIFIGWVGVLLYNFFMAVAMGPGFVPLKWRPDQPDDEQFLQYCANCDGFKTPRSHHCRKCERCVFKMDHHCPWINTCCGHRNHANFTLFLFFAVCGSIHALVLLIMGLAKAYHRKYYMRQGQEDNLVYLGFFPFLATVLSLGLAIGVIIAVGSLFVIQVEQILQKHDKRLRTRLYTVVHPYRGSFFPISHGCSVCMTTPLTDEPRIAVSPGDRVLVTRWKKHWLYGELESAKFSTKSSRRLKGWFPRQCAVEVAGSKGSRSCTEASSSYADNKKYK